MKHAFGLIQTTKALFQYKKLTLVRYPRSLFSFIWILSYKSYCKKTGYHLAYCREPKHKIIHKFRNNLSRGKEAYKENPHPSQNTSICYYQRNFMIIRLAFFLHSFSSPFFNFLRPLFIIPTNKLIIFIRFSF